MGDEELRAAGVGTGQRHAHGAPRVLLQVDLVADRVARTTVLVVPGIAALDHEVRDDAHERRVVEVLLLRELREVSNVVLSGGQLSLKGKIFRIGTMGDISQTDVLGMLGAVEIAMLEQGVPVHLGKGVQAALHIFLEAEKKPTRDGDQKTDAQKDARTTEARR